MGDGFCATRARAISTTCAALLDADADAALDDELKRAVRREASMGARLPASAAVIGRRVVAARKAIVVDVM